MRVTGSGYYAWRKREPSERHKQNQRLLGQIRSFFERSASKRMAACAFCAI